VSRRTSAVIATFTVFGLTFGTTAATTGSATASTGGPGPRPQVVRSAHPHGVQVARNSRGRLTNLAANPLSPITVPDPSLARQARPSALLSARAHVRVLAPSLGVPDAGKDLTATLVRPLADAPWYGSLNGSTGSRPSVPGWSWVSTRRARCKASPLGWPPLRRR